MNTKAIRSWLIKTPRPIAVRVKPVDGEARMVDVTTSGTWQAIAESIEALDPELLEAVDASGKVLRVVKPLDEDDQGDEDAHVPELVSSDAETQRLVVFGQLLAGAYKHSTDVAFARMVDLFEACNRRSETLERSLDSMTKLLNRAVREQYDAASSALAQVPEEGGLGALISGFLQGQAKAEVEKAVGGIVNGTTAGKV